MESWLDETVSDGEVVFLVIRSTEMTEIEMAVG